LVVTAVVVVVVVTTAGVVVVVLVVVIVVVVEELVEQEAKTKDATMRQVRAIQIEPFFIVPPFIFVVDSWKTAGDLIV
jgi:hypothetical protein